MRIPELPSAGQVHDPLGVALALQPLENRQVLAIHTGQQGIVDRVVVVPRGVLVQDPLLFSDRAPKTSSGLGDSSEIIRIVRGVPPTRRCSSEWWPQWGQEQNRESKPMRGWYAKRDRRGMV